MTTRALVLLTAFAACAVPTDCPPFRMWEQSSYAVHADATTPSGLALDGDLDPARVDAVADAVDACLGDRGHVERECTTVAARPGERACTRDLWVLPDSAGTSCETYGKPDADCPCRWAVATQDGGRTVVVPTQEPYTRLAEGLVRAATRELYPWGDALLARCSAL